MREARQGGEKQLYVGGGGERCHLGVAADIVQMGGRKLCISMEKEGATLHTGPARKVLKISGSEFPDDNGDRQAQISISERESKGGRGGNGAGNCVRKSLGGWTGTDFSDIKVRWEKGGKGKNGKMQGNRKRLPSSSHDGATVGERKVADR